ncbi:MAG TPA: ABC transporter permease [Pyrinomonadaceae bacterium]|nr:ABC transporter permease [Pyrinomonadaceae bacterium]
MRKELGTFILLVVLCVVLAILNPAFLDGANLQNLARLIGIYGIFSIGLGLVIITGGIDLSVGSVFALLGVILSILLVDWHLPTSTAQTLSFLPEWLGLILGAFLAVLITVGITTILGVFNGLLITKVKMQPFIVTLCGLLFYRGLARYVANDETKGFGAASGFETLKELATGSVFGIPTPFIILIFISIIAWVVLHRSIFGRYLFAVGRNEIAAKYSGINSDSIITGAYILCGFLAGIAGILLAFYTNSISPSSHGNSYELYGIAAAVLGGCSLRGGSGSIVGILIGTALLQVLQNLVNLLGIPSSLNFAVMGVVILLGVIADQVLQNRKAKQVKS